MNTYFGKLVEDYTADWYSACCDEWTAFCNEVCDGLDDERKKRLQEIYIQGSMHELYFWQMAGGEKERV